MRRATGWLADAPAAWSQLDGGGTGRPLPLNAVCDPRYWQDGEWRNYGRALGLPQDEGWYHRKVWEWTQCVYGLERLRALGKDKMVLGVGAGHEQVLYYLANRSAATIGTDLYSGDFSARAAKEADPEFLKDPAKFAPFVYDRHRLLALPADGCQLPFRSGSFHAVYSLSSIEHFGGHERASQAMREMSRILAPGGIACVATELVLEGGPHPAYFTLDDLYRYVVQPAGMQLVEPLTHLRPPQDLIDDPVKLPEEYLRTPHIVLQEAGWKFTSICVFMRKRTRLDACSEWSGQAVRRLEQGRSRARRKLQGGGPAPTARGAVFAGRRLRTARGSCSQ